MSIGTEAVLENENAGNQIAARDDNRKLALLVAIKRIPKPTESDLVQATNIPNRSVQEMIKNFPKMSVIIDRTNGRRFGYYTILDEGAYNLTRIPLVLKKNYPNIYQNIEKLAIEKEAAGQEDNPS